MPAIPVIGAVAAVAGAGAAIVGTINARKAQKKALAAQQAAAAFERQKARLQEARQRMEAIRAGRAAYAGIQQSAENQGVAMSSAAAGGAGSVISQMGTNLSFLDQYGFLSDQASSSLQRAMKHESTASMWGSVAGLGMQMFSAAGGFNAFKGPKPPPPPSSG